MTKSAIDKMVEWLETRVKFFTETHERINTLDVRSGLLDALAFARRLQAEEAKEKPTCPAEPGNACQLCSVNPCSERRYINPNLSAHKPTAPASLVEELNELYFRHLEYETIERFAREMYLALCRYRPTPQADILGELKKVVKAIEYSLEKMMGESCYVHLEAKGHYLGCKETYTGIKETLEQVVRKFEGGVK